MAHCCSFRQPWPDKHGKGVVMTGFESAKDMESLPKGSCVLIKRGDGRVLAVTRPFRTTLGLPGGKREPGEDSATNAARELFEETGVSVDPKDLVLLRSGACENEPGGGARAHWVDAFVLGDGVVAGEARQVEDGVGVEWVTPSEMLERAAFPVHLRAVMEAAGLA